MNILDSFLDSKESQHPSYYEPVLVEEVSAERFTELMRTNRASIAHFSIQTPQLGSYDEPFGTFLVEYTSPMLREKIYEGVST